MKPAIRVENVSKRYRVQQERKRAGYSTLREDLVRGFFRAATLGGKAGRGEPDHRLIFTLDCYYFRRAEDSLGDFN